MNFITLVGVGGAVCTTVCLIPQVIQIHKTKQTRDLSLGMYVIFLIGIALWLIYGVAIQDLPLMLANGVTLPLAVYILIMKIKHR